MRPSRRRRRAVLLASAVVLTAGVLPLLGVSRADPPQGEKYALLVGVRRYDPNELRDLPYAEDDVTALADVLKKAGYKRVVLMTQTEGATQARCLPEAARIRTTLKGMLEDRTEGDTVLVAFAGHGIQYQGEEENYFCPMDAKLTDRSTLISLGQVYKELEKSDAGTRLLLADCCRNDPRSDHSQAADGVKLESVTRPQKAKPPGGVEALFSCSAGEKAFESVDLKHGVFFHFVIEGLKGKADLDHDGQVSLQELELYTQKQVPDYVKDKYGDDRRQMPQRVGKTQGLVSLVSLDGGHPLPLDCTGEKGVSAADVRKSQEAWARYLGRKVEEEDEIAPGVKMRFVLVPPGRFLMGSPKEEKERFDDETLHEVELRMPFYLGAYDVTQAQYEAVTGKNPSHFKGASDLPVETVSWEEADGFAKRLTDKPRDGLVYRLPTESEWEYACRGGRPSSQPFGIGDGTSLSSRNANFNGGYPYGGADKGPYLGKTSPVGSYKPNALGLYDMQGNVWQWCADRYGDYPTGGRVIDPLGPASGPSRVARGGGWRDAGFCRAADRGNNVPGYRFNDVGFRLARVPSGLAK